MKLYKPILALSLLIGDYGVSGCDIHTPQDFAPTFFSVMRRCDKEDMG